MPRCPLHCPRPVWTLVLLLGLLGLFAGTAWAQPQAAPADTTPADELAPAPLPPLPDDDAVLRGWIESWKTDPRGPFERLRWFCADGTTQPPRAYACANHGGGVQHGEWDEHALILRANGFLVANVLAAIEPNAFLDSPTAREDLEQIVLEKYLVQARDGWILRQARFYRGAFQVEDEERVGRELLESMLGRPAWRDQAYPVLMEAVRYLPHGAQRAPVERMRDLSTRIAEAEPAFMDLRVKLHGTPDVGDIELVRAYKADREARLAEQAAQDLADRLTTPPPAPAAPVDSDGEPAPEPLDVSAALDELIAVLEEVYQRPPLDQMLRELARRIPSPRLATALRREAPGLDANAPPAKRLETAGRVMQRLRQDLTATGPVELRLSAMDLMVALEQEVMVLGDGLAAEPYGPNGREWTREQRLEQLGSVARALYGAGYLNRRELDAALAEITTLTSDPRLTLSRYREGVQYLARVPDWAERTLRFHFTPAVQRFSRLDPDAATYFHFRLRGSPVLAYGRLTDLLLADADQMAGLNQRVFGYETGGVQGLNPGLARGVLHVLSEDAAHGDLTGLDPQGIYVLPQTVENLPPVAGIITRGRGNVLSHVQLLARNLGVPNVAVEARLLPELEARDGRKVVLAVSPGGVVRLDEDGPGWNKVFAQAQTQARSTGQNAMISVDTARLDLTDTLLTLDDLRASDSGRLAGPKAANLGELRAAFPNDVPQGVVVPFGVYSRHLQQPAFPNRPGSPSMAKWLDWQYRRLAGMPATRRDRETAKLLDTAREWFATTPLEPELRQELAASLARAFPDWTPQGGGPLLFVRSDTNVEDLPGFTGAGLNATVPGVRGLDAVEQAIRTVWASPFRERAWAWRQSHMRDPGDLYVSVLIQQGIDSEVSGVMVSTDVQGLRPGWLTVAASEGVGGAVSGQSAEEVLLSPDGSRLRFLAPAAEPTKRVLAPEGGVRKVPASGREQLITPEMAVQLAEVARTAPARFPTLHAGTEQIPADVEFGFRPPAAKGQPPKLWLFQIRPFAESDAARQSAFLRDLDRSFIVGGTRPVALDRPPLGDIP